MLALATAALGIDNGFKTPAMGWSALYGAPFGSVNETIVAIAAEGLNTSGLLAFGYNRVNLDDWYAIRDGQSGKIKADPKNFPSGMRAISDKVHAAGCLFGVYSAASMRTCANFSASLFNEVNDANTFAHDWQVDMLKYDACRYNAGVAPRPRYLAMGRALNATGRPILYSVEGWTPKTDSKWGPEVADSWRTGSDIWPNWDNMPNCILNNVYQTNAAAEWHEVGKGFNDPDMLQPPNTLKTVLTPGLDPVEAYAQYKLWVLMKSPLVLGVNWEQIADLKTLEPTYFAMLTNPEILAINHDMSPQGVLVRQYPSHAQQSKLGGGRGGAPLAVTLQACDYRRASQRWVPGPTAGTIALDGTKLCLVQNGTSAGIALAPCSATSTVWGMTYDDLAVHIGTAGSDGKLCVDSPHTSPSDIVALPALKSCLYTGPLPPASLFETNFADQAYVWGPGTKQIIAAGASTCFTAGLTNDGQGLSTASGSRWVTNNGTLEHEVWMGDLTPLADGSRRRAVALFNKGEDLDAIFAPASLYSRELPGVDPATTAVKVRDVVRRTDVAVAPGAPIASNVPRHGVDLYVITYPALAAPSVTEL